MFLVATHFVADFVFQSDWMALNKSKDWRALLAHVFIYTFTVWLVMCAMGYQDRFLYGFAVLTFITHFVTDAVTSRITSKLWFIDFQTATQYSRLSYCKFFDGVTVYPNRRHWFFVMIGLDQLIHYVTLAWTWYYLGGL